MSHWAEQIPQCRTLQQYSAEMHEHEHNTNLKDGWNASNHYLNYLPQVISFQRRILSFEIRELNLQAVAQGWENSATTCKVFRSGDDLAAPQSFPSNVKPKVMGPQNLRDGKHPDTLIKDCRALLENMQEAMHHAAIYRGMREFIKHMSRNKTYISDEQLHTIELCIYHGIKVEVEGLEGERMS